MNAFFDREPGEGMKDRADVVMGLIPFIIYCMSAFTLGNPLFVVQQAALTRICAHVSKQPAVTPRIT